MSWAGGLYIVAAFKSISGSAKPCRLGSTASACSRKRLRVIPRTSRGTPKRCPVIEVATANMYAAFSNVLARHGLDPRDFALVAFGGAGPIEACFLAEEFHIPRVIVPPSPGTLCAQGAMTADVKSDYVKTIHRKLSATSGKLLAAECAELTARAKRWLWRSVRSRSSFWPFSVSHSLRSRRSRAPLFCST